MSEQGEITNYCERCGEITDVYFYEETDEFLCDDCVVEVEEDYNNE